MVIERCYVMIDYCNSVLYGAPAATFDALQRVQNILARVVTQNARRSSVKPLLQLLHWLPVRQRVTVHTGDCICMLQDKIDIDTSIPSVTARK